MEHPVQCCFQKIIGQNLTVKNPKREPDREIQNPKNGPDWNSRKPKSGSEVRFQDPKSGPERDSEKNQQRTRPRHSRTPKAHQTVTVEIMGRRTPGLYSLQTPLLHLPAHNSVFRPLLRLNSSSTPLEKLVLNRHFQEPLVICRPWASLPLEHLGLRPPSL